MLLAAPELSIESLPVVSISIPPLPALMSIPPEPLVAVSLIASTADSVEVILTDAPAL